MPIDQREDRLASRLIEGTRAILLRQLAIESLERLLVEEHRFRMIHGRFTRNLQRLDWEVPRELRAGYEFTVVEASQDRLLVTATSETVGNTPADVVSIDQDSRTHASFPLPPPRPEYLRERVRFELASQGEDLGRAAGLSSAQGAWPGYYELRDSGAGGRIALGFKPPVLGDRIEAVPGDGAEPVALRPRWRFIESAKAEQAAAGREVSQVRGVKREISSVEDDTSSPLIVEPLR